MYGSMPHAPTPSRLAILLCFALAVGPASCARLSPASHEFARIVLPETGADPAPFEEPLRRRLAGLKTFRASGVLQFEKADRPIRQTNFLLLAGPARQTRLRGTRAIGPVLFELIADGEAYTFTIPTRRQAYVGRRGAQERETTLLTPGAITDPLRIQLHVGAIRYVSHQPDTTALVELVRDEPDGGWRIAQRIEFARETGRVARVVAYNAEGAPLMISTFADYRQLPDTGPDDTFLHFLREALHPVVQQDRNRTHEQSEAYNEYLRRDGWELVGGACAG